MRSVEARRLLRRWSLRSSTIFVAVYVMGLFGVPTLIPYVAAVWIVVGDAVRLWYRARSGTGSVPQR